MNRNNNQNGNYYGNNYNQNQGNYYNNGNNRQYGNYNNNRQYNRQYNNQYYNQNGQRGQYNQNMQYQQYNAYNNPENKKKKEKNNKEFLKKIGIVVGAIILVICLFLLTKSCSKDNNEEEIKDEEIQRIGSNEYGFISVPSDWLRLEGTTTSSGIKYSDKDISYVATLDTSSTLNPQEFVYTARNQLQTAGVSDFAIDELEFCGYSAYRLTGYHQGQNKYILAYFFRAEDNITHYVGVEGPDNQNENFKIPDTYNLTK